MEPSVSSIQLGQLFLEGAVITLATELIFRNLYSTKKYKKSLTVRSLKITLGVGMAVKSAIFASFNAKYVIVQSNKHIRKLLFMK
jgi:hypothetical protein